MKLLLQIFVDAAAGYGLPPSQIKKAFIFYSGHPDVSTAIIIILTVVFGTHYAFPQCVYRNENLSWP